ncbi:B1065G12.17 [Oryza sativa Japonica Group]|uniref:B1065G12.17 protein n=1 Tax=Oryza sativa subsp. japonica TaxID=39947 RepID=Q8RZ78_ORYSJ|nr:B1065G12.17 [Oryza sativa Japonica Group]
MRAIYMAQNSPMSRVRKGTSPTLTPLKSDLNLIRDPQPHNRYDPPNYSNQCNLNSLAVLDDGFADMALTWRC